jgi:hypothetical protein
MQKKVRATIRYIGDHPDGFTVFGHNFPRGEAVSAELPLEKIEWLMSRGCERVETLLPAPEAAVARGSNESVAAIYPEQEIEIVSGPMKELEAAPPPEPSPVKRRGKRG